MLNQVREFNRDEGEHLKMRLIWKRDLGRITDTSRHISDNKLQSHARSIIPQHETMWLALICFMQDQWFPNFFLSRRISEKTEIIRRTSNIWIKNFFEYVIFPYPNEKSRQYCLSSQEI